MCIPSEEERKTDGLEYAGNDSDGNGVKRTLLGGDLGNELVVVSFNFIPREISVSSIRGPGM